jgi:hypothetical protein
MRWQAGLFQRVHRVGLLDKCVTPATGTIGPTQPPLGGAYALSNACGVLGKPPSLISMTCTRY